MGAEPAPPGVCAGADVAGMPILSAICRSSSSRDISAVPSASCAEEEGRESTGGQPRASRALTGPFDSMQSKDSRLESRDSGESTEPNHAEWNQTGPPPRSDLTSAGSNNGSCTFDRKHGNDVILGSRMTRAQGRGGGGAEFEGLPLRNARWDPCLANPSRLQERLLIFSSCGLRPFRCPSNS